MFPGGFINFGYWAGIDTDSHIRYSSRITSQAQLYEQVIDELSVTPDSQLIEVGCGRGNGARIALYDYNAAQVCGIDASADQVERSRNKIKGNLPGRLFFELGTAEDLPFDNDAVDGLYSVEAIQHFPSVSGFLGEAHRVLKRDAGRIAFCTFYATSDKYIDELQANIPTYRDGLDNLLVKDNVSVAIEAAGFKKVSLRSVGAFVWKGFDRWMHQVRPEDKWPDAEAWLQAYTEGKLDYGIFSASK